MSADGMDNRGTVTSARASANPTTRDARATAATTGGTSAALMSVVMGSNDKALLLADARGVIVSANRAFELATEMSASEIVGRNLADLLSPGQAAQARSVGRAVLRGAIWQGDVSLRTDSGTPLVLRVKVTPVLNAARRVAHLVVQGADEARKATSGELDRHVQILGRLNSSIAHDFNNQLSVIINYTHILSSELPQDSALQDHLHDMQTTAWRATKLAHQLIVLGQCPITEPQSLDLNEVINNLTPLLRSMLGERVKLHTALESALWRVLMVLPQAEQVLVNLAVNARDAMVGAGEVELVTSNVTLHSDDPSRPVDLPPGCYVRFSLSEQAVQTNPTTITPVDATTPLASLGPTMIYRAIREAGGSLALLADDNGGTTFRIHIPALRPEHDSNADSGDTRVHAPA